MKNWNALEFDDGAMLATDVCIVGTGAVGLAIANQFVDSNADVLVMEGGGLAIDDASQSLNDFESVGDPVRAVNEHGLPSRSRCLGGTTTIWGGRCAEMQPIDFEKRDWIPDSGWPISYDDLSTYYERASRTLQLPDTGVSQLTSAEDQFLRDGSLEPVEFLFARRPVNMKSEYAATIENSRNVRVCLNANAVEIEASHDLSTITKIHFRTLRGNTVGVTAKVFVLACGGWENARLLLLSRKQMANGLTNQHDTVGRYYMEHPILREGIIVQKQPLLRSSNLLCPAKVSGGSAKLGLRLTEETQREERLPNHYVDPVPLYDEPLEQLPYARKGFYRLLQPWSRKSFPTGYWRQLGKGVEFLRAQFSNRPFDVDRVALINHLEQAPNRESRVTLSDEKDALGLPRLQVDLKVTHSDKESLIRFHEVLKRAIQQHDVGQLESDFPDVDSNWARMTDAFHHMGTTRMNEDPRKGVVGADCRVHGLNNLYVSGSSVFPTGGCVNPTLTIVALSLRLADHIRAAMSD